MPGWVVLVQDITFQFIVCHKELSHENPIGAPYYGFYKNSRPLLNTFIPVTVTLELILFIHLSLVDIDTTGRPFELGHQFFNLDYVKIEFDLVMVQQASKYHSEVEKAIRELLKQQFPGSSLGIIDGYDLVRQGVLHVVFLL
ncbi:hypothetical protein CY34DRAFT_106849 [Suillus luteus UH-Slu-Lm8-n1]|uniref:Uncharacterized protein n=1 Tax=Suillus luteus UH-Slu-Lm8-n1 TaxID=930992 RepID=A0A0C9ZXR3_9AGAM|nr:hypothetical protein CY34DRAFT_106849 [Suillus luteus UH-Slu-Lm8-n1]